MKNENNKTNIKTLIAGDFNIDMKEFEDSDCNHINNKDNIYKNIVSPLMAPNMVCNNDTLNIGKYLELNKINDFRATYKNQNIDHIFSDLPLRTKKFNLYDNNISDHNLLFLEMSVV